MVDIRCPECGGKTTIRTTKEGDSQYFVCVKYPKCKGRVPAEEDLSGGWGRESPAPEAAHDSPRQRKEPSSTKSGGGTAVRKSGKAKRGSDAGVKRPERKSRVPVEENWGDDWDDEILAPKPALAKPRRHVAPKPEVAPEKKEPPRPRLKIVAKKEEHPEPQRQKAPKPASYRPQYKRGPGPAPVLPQEPERPKPAPYKPLFKRPKSWETAPEVNESSGPQGRGETKPVSYRPQYRRGPKSAPVAPQESGGPPPTPYRPQYPRAQKRQVASEVKEHPKPRRHKAPKASHEEPRPQKPPKST